jgi:hypothetical protein
MRVKISKEGDAYTLVPCHGFGPKWSILSESAARELTKQFSLVEPQVSRGSRSSRPASSSNLGTWPAETSHAGWHALAVIQNASKKD